MKAVEPTIKTDTDSIWTLSMENDDFYYEIQRSGLDWLVYLVDATDEQDWLLSKRSDHKDVVKIMRKCGVTALFSGKL